MSVAAHARAAASPKYVALHGTNAANTAGATTLATTQPSGVRAGDYGIFTFRQTGATITSTPASQGWTQGTGNANSVFYKLYGASEANPSVSVNTSNDWVEALFVAKNVNQANPLDQAPSSATFSSGTSFAGSSLTTVNPRTFLVSVFVYNPSSTASLATLTGPSGYTVVASGPIFNHKCIVAIAYKTSPDSALANAGSVISSPTWGTSIAAFSAQVVNFLLCPSS